MLRRGARRTVELARSTRPTVDRLHRAGRLRAFETRVKARAIWSHATVTLDLHPSAWIGAVDLDVWPGTDTTVVVGAGARLGDGVRLSLRGGSLLIGADADVRRNGTYHVAGRLEIGAACMLSVGVCVHCADAVTIGDLTIIGEYSTIADSAHCRTPPGVPVQHSVRTAPVCVGSNVWMGAHVVVTSGTTVGDQCFVGAGAVVTRDIPAGWLAAGIPAEAIRALELSD